MLQPMNNYLVVEPVLEKQEESGILVPDDYKVNQSAFCLVKLIAKTSNSRLTNVPEGTNIIVPSHMVEEINLFGEIHHVVLENNVVGFFGN